MMRSEVFSEIAVNRADSVGVLTNNWFRYRLAILFYIFNHSWSL